MAQIFLNSFGQSWTLVLWSFIIVAQYVPRPFSSQFPHRSQVHDGLIASPWGLPPDLCILERRRPPHVEADLPNERLHRHTYKRGLIRLPIRTRRRIISVVELDRD